MCVFDADRELKAGGDGAWAEEGNVKRCPGEELKWQVIGDKGRPLNQFQVLCECLRSRRPHLSLDVAQHAVG